MLNLSQTQRSRSAGGSSWGWQPRFSGSDPRWLCGSFLGPLVPGFFSCPVTRRRRRQPASQSASLPSPFVFPWAWPSSAEFTDRRRAGSDAHRTLDLRRPSSEPDHCDDPTPASRPQDPGTEPGSSSRSYGSAGSWMKRKHVRKLVTVSGLKVS